MISEDKFKKLVKSIKEFPEMLDVRPVVVDEEFMILGGNMRLKALQEAGVEEVEVTQVKGWSEEKKKEFIIKDNIGYGTWDWDALANGWNVEELDDWGLDLPEWTADEEPTGEDLIGENNEKPLSLKITFQTLEDLENAKVEIESLLDCYQGAFLSVSGGEL